MTKVIWKKINVKQLPRRGCEAFATVGQGRISLSAAACKLIDDIYDFSCIEAHSGKVNDTIEKIGLSFSKIKSQDALSFSRRKYKGEFVDGLDISSKALVAELFGKIKDNTSTRYPVEKVDNDMLAINITKEL